MSPTSSYEHATREQSRRQAESLRRDLAVLIVDHLRREGMVEAAEAAKERLAWDVDEYREVQLDCTTKSELLHMLFEICHTKNRNKSIKQHIKYFKS